MAHEDISRNFWPEQRKLLLEKYGEHYGQMSVEEYARIDGQNVRISPGARDPETIKWSDHLNTHIWYPEGATRGEHDFALSVENQRLYKRVFLEEYEKAWDFYWR